MNIFLIFIYVYIILSVWYVISAVHINRNNLYQKITLLKCALHFIKCVIPILSKLFLIKLKYVFMYSFIHINMAVIILHNHIHNK